MSDPEAKVVLPALKSNNLALNILSCFKILEAATIMRSLNLKGKEKTPMLANHCQPFSLGPKQVLTFDKQGGPDIFLPFLLEFERIFGFKLPLILELFKIDQDNFDCLLAFVYSLGTSIREIKCMEI